MASAFTGRCPFLSRSIGCGDVGKIRGIYIQPVTVFLVFLVFLDFAYLEIGLSNSIESSCVRHAGGQRVPRTEQGTESIISAERNSWSQGYIVTGLAAFG